MYSMYKVCPLDSHCLPHAVHTPPVCYALALGDSHAIICPFARARAVKIWLFVRAELVP